MTGLDRYLPATRTGESTLRANGIKELPVDPIALARHHGIEVQANDSCSSGVSGILVRSGDQFGIMYSTRINNIGFQNFSVAHELGHYFLPGHVEALFENGDRHESRAGFKFCNRYETEADHFAVGLLMPQLLFEQAMQTSGIGLNAIRALADRCQTSLLATAIRYTQLTCDPVAIVVSAGKQIDYCFMSDALKEVKGLGWILKGSFLPENTLTFSFNQKNEHIRSGKRETSSSSLQDWFDVTYDTELVEEIVGLGKYGRTLTVLTAQDLPEPEELEEEEQLIDSWQPNF